MPMMASSSYAHAHLDHSQLSAHAKDSHQTQGRKRAAVACIGCRSKRTKCDGRQPQCGACRYREQPCEYSNVESKRKRHSNAYISALEARVASLEKRIVELSGNEDPLLTGFDINDFGFQIPNVEKDTQTSLDLQRVDTEDSTVSDLADTLGCFVIGDVGELRFFGSSSNFDIIQDPSLRVASSLEARMRGIAAAKSAAGYFEPSEELRDHLLALFWRWQNSWQYVVPRDSFVRELYVSGMQRYCTPLLLYAILALASRYSDRLELRTDPNDANTAGAAFAAQAKIMVHHEYDAPTTATVQATALLGLYWAAVDREGLGFMYIGMASRMAMNLGLHSDVSAYASNGLIPEEDIEVRSIAFWGVYVLDKLYCLGMGRPAGIQEYNITTTKPKAIDIHVAGLPEKIRRISTPWPTSHVTDNAMHTCEILLITSELFDQLYAQRSTWTEKEREDRVAETQLRLVKFFDGLPKHLKISESSLQPAAPYVYQLHLQYHVSNIFMHRPFLKNLYRGPNTIEYDPTGKEIHSKACKAAAVKIANILRIFKNNYTHRSFPVSAVHPAFTAAIVHLLDYKTAQAQDQKGALQRLRVCIDSLYGMNINWDWANRSIRAIHYLAAQWGLDLQDQEVNADVSEESLLQFEKYEASCIPMGIIPNFANQFNKSHTDISFEDFFDPWTQDHGIFTGAFDLFNNY